MGINEAAKQFLTKYAVSVLKRNPGLIFNQIENRFVTGLRPIKVGELIQAFKDKTNLLEFVNEEDDVYLKRLLQTPEAREIYRASLRPNITPELMVEWIRKHRPDLWSLITYWENEAPMDYIRDQHARGIKHIDDICEALEKERLNQEQADIVDIEEVEE